MQFVVSLDKLIILNSETIMLRFTGGRVKENYPGRYVVWKTLWILIMSYLTTVAEYRTFELHNHHYAMGKKITQGNSVIKCFLPDDARCW